jgi:cell division protein FtsL
MNIVRILNILAFVLLIGSAVAVYRIKYEAIFHAEDVARLERAIETERATITTLQTEWARLARPDRIETLAKQHLGLAVTRPEQTQTLASLPARPQTIDSIAQTIESLGLDAAEQADPIANAIDSMKMDWVEPTVTGSTR